jgi:hypothetical protein
MKFDAMYETLLLEVTDNGDQVIITEGILDNLSGIFNSVKNKVDNIGEIQEAIKDLLKNIGTVPTAVYKKIVKLLKNIVSLMKPKVFSILKIALSVLKSTYAKLTNKYLMVPLLVLVLSVVPQIASGAVKDHMSKEDYNTISSLFEIENEFGSLPTAGAKSLTKEDHQKLEAFFAKVLKEISNKKTTDYESYTKKSEDYNKLLSAQGWNRSKAADKHMAVDLK